MLTAKCVVFLSFTLPIFGHEPLTCRDENGVTVSWFVLYKLPRLKEHSEESIQQGLAFTSLTSTKHKNWVLHKQNVSSVNSHPAQSLRSVYSDPGKDSLVYVFYNDEHPNGPTSMSLGHTKGVVAFDGESGIWLVHSVPHYPPPPDQGYGYPSSGRPFGQSFLCVTLNSSQLESVALQLLYNQPFIYASRLARELEAKYPLMKRVVSGQFNSVSPWHHMTPLVSASGGSFVSFAKSDQFGKELYADWVASSLKTSLMTETWRNGPHQDLLPSACSQQFRVLNIDELELAAECAVSGSSVTVSFRNGQDHSKWAVSGDHRRPWICVGDINRMSTQEVRGGGTVCTSSQALWSVFYRMVKSSEPCPNSSSIRN